MKIIVLGTRGIPDILGGVETHCQELYTRIEHLGNHDITVITRSPYVVDKSKTNFQNIKLKHFFAPKAKSFEAIVHTFFGILYAGIKRPDILHIHAIGPMLLTPFARLLWLKVVVTHHGPDYNRQKWGKTAKRILKLGEYMGVKFAHEVIVISEVIQKSLITKFNRTDAHLIYNGVNLPKVSSQTDYIESLNLQSKKYIIAVGRFVEEKGLHDLIDAFIDLQTSVKLVLVGDADHETSYSKHLKTKANNNNIVLTGFIKGEKLNQIFSHALLFVMPSYHEGLPIALLEAMSYNLNVLVSDIPANLEVQLEDECYFKTGNIDDLKTKLDIKLKSDLTYDFQKVITKKYNWDLIAKKTCDVYSNSERFK